ncbi:zinc ribbon domain-containing protein [Paenibacillus physcomitrellae]|uniref:Zinc ribbon domain-containing protein n=1 Tax=Paenibacillus physcomitrellae TaxID=1619311 RepID=A0ABQ1FVD0_9BACL|nr:zinc ribbon domain-containing protein [Paenibacillus physcomitrellae]GGA31832.1 hypothetical protein GCM10010917_16220 [Paenibacillus physcomitrellae]
MSFLDRIKNGANKASERAQHVVEINKLNGQISNIEREMGIYYQQMGQVFYEGYRAKDMSLAEKEMMELAKTCDLLAEERDELRHRIAALRNERLCECGKVVPQEAIYCPYCGRKLKSRGESPNAAPYQAEQEGPVREPEEAVSEAGAAMETMVYRGPLVKEEPEYEAAESVPFSSEDEKRRQLELERERERQLELDRRIQTWKENMIPPKPASPSRAEESNENVLKCQICSTTLAKGTRWCPHCGAEQI